jgi:hypothetical protein
MIFISDWSSDGVHGPRRQFKTMADMKKAKALDWQESLGL